jgi:hypothetical protein
LYIEAGAAALLCFNRIVHGLLVLATLAIASVVGIGTGMVGLEDVLLFVSSVVEAVDVGDGLSWLSCFGV